MTIIEAIKSGKAFKRLCWLGSHPDGEYVLIDNNLLYLVRFVDGKPRYFHDCDFTADDILADDWIVREE